MRVHVIGNACIDSVFRVPRFPAPGETLNAISLIDGLGGKGANQAVAAARTGADVTLWTALGTDESGRRIADALRCELSLGATLLDQPSDRSSIIVDDVGENVIISGVACIEAFNPVGQTTLAERMANGDLVALQANMTAKATDDCLRLARRAGARSIVNASPIGQAPPPDLTLADVVVVNAGEARALSGETDLSDAVKRLARESGGAVVVTLGSEGCLVLDRGAVGAQHLAAPQVDAVDTSGAGDVFCGCLTGFLAQGFDLNAAARLAVAASAIAVTRPGTLAACPSAAEMRALVKQMELI